MARTEDLECLFKDCTQCPFKNEDGTCNPPTEGDDISKIIEWIKDHWDNANGMLSDETVLDCLKSGMDSGYDFQPDFDDYEWGIEDTEDMPHITEEMKPKLIALLRQEVCNQYKALEVRIFVMNWCANSDDLFDEVWDWLESTCNDEELSDIGYVEEVMDRYHEGRNE